MDLPGSLMLMNGGVFSRAQVLALGESDRSLAHAVRAGELVRLRHGAYVRASDLAARDERGRHLLLARAVLAGQRGRVALAGPSAALLQGYTVWGHDLSLVHLVRLDSGAGRREAGVVHHLAADGETELEVLEGLLTVGPCEAVWQVAVLSTLESAVVTADSALHLAPEMAAPLHELGRRRVRHPRSRRARFALHLARAGSESPGESLTRVACFRHGIPEPDLQHDVVSEDGRLLGRSDFYWSRSRHLGEFDGKIKYERFLRPGETSSHAVVREKKREDKMRSTGKGMSRFVWSEVLPELAGRRMAELAQELERSRVLYVRGGRPS